MQKEPSVKTLILNESFQEWVLFPTPENNALWEAWVSNNAVRKEFATEAAKFIKHVKRRQSSDLAQVKTTEKRKVWDAINVQISNNNHADASSSKVYKSRWNISSRVAASVCGALLLIALTWGVFFAQTPHTVTTGDAHISDINLWDGSLISLNANSELHYQAPLLNHPWHYSYFKDREVWLKGEAVFNVSSQPDKQVFFVHNITSGVNVEVVGTKFNVNNRSRGVDIVLKEGKVKLHIPAKNGKKSEVLEMNPGDRIVTNDQGKVNRSLVNPNAYMSWQHREFIFESTSLAEIARKMKSFYGIEVVFEDKGLADKKFTGKVSTERLDILVKAIAEAHQLKYRKEENKLYFKKDPGQKN